MLMTSLMTCLMTFLMASLMTSLMTCLMTSLITSLITSLMTSLMTSLLSELGRYKLIGSVELLFNPLAFLDKLGGGVLEFFRAPADGFVSDGFVGLGLGFQIGVEVRGGLWWPRMASDGL